MDNAQIYPNLIKKKKKKTNFIILALFIFTWPHGFASKLHFFNLLLIKQVIIII